MYSSRSDRKEIAVTEQFDSKNFKPVKAKRVSLVEWVTLACYRKALIPEADTLSTATARTYR